MTAQIYITRQPVLNKQRAITANRLCLHTVGVVEPDGAISDALNDLLDDWPAARTVFIGFAAEFAADVLGWKAPPNTMIEVPASMLQDAAGQQLIGELDAGGTPLCLDGYRSGMSLAGAPNFHFLLVDAGLAPRVAGAPGLALACRLADAAAFEVALKSGFDGAAGWFFLRAKPVSGKLTPSHSQIVRLLNLVRRNAEVREIEQVLKQDVALAARLLRYINSAAFGLRSQIQSFRHAVTILGYEKLHKWLSLLLVTSSKDPQAPALTQASVVRGRFMENIGKQFFDKTELDNLFITGAFSLLDVLVGAPLDTMLKEMHLPQAIYDALIDHDGVYADFVDLALACENDDVRALSAKAAEVGVDAMDINRAHLRAIAFADSLAL